MPKAVLAKPWIFGLSAFALLIAGAETTRADILALSGTREDSASSELRINNATQSSDTPPAIDNFTTSVNFNNTVNGAVSFSNGSASGTATQSSNGPLIGTTGTVLSGSGAAEYAFNVPAGNNFATADGEAIYGLNFQVTEAQDFLMSGFVISGGGLFGNSYVALYNTADVSNPLFYVPAGSMQSNLLLQPGVTYNLYAQVQLGDDVSEADQERTDEFTFSLTPNGPPLSSPEPATFAMLGTGFIALGGLGARRLRRGAPGTISGPLI